MIGMLAVSRMGHDKADIYVIVKEDAEYVYLCDGKHRPLRKPKRKNRKHIQVIKKHLDTSSIESSLEQGTLKDEDIKRIIKEYILNS